FRLKKQIYLSDDSSFSMTLSKKIISAKITNQTVLLRRYARHSDMDISEETAMMKNCLSKIEGCTGKDELTGYEGTAAKYYFKGLSKLVDPRFSFNGRNRMPPKDPFNSMLSLGYTMLMYEIYGEIENKGLSPYAGFLHKDHVRHPSLASDLMEEWRPVIVDSVVMSLVNGREISPDEFVHDEETDGVYLTKTGMKIFIAKLEAKLRSETGYLEQESRISFRKALWHQVNALTQAVDRSDTGCYEPIVIR
ncbi:MAG: CRISPR-associated endonuclease Cas1, partial [Ruminococcus sp.]|nr:CRISPR-associated endonuclease Cas1 [Ruminococcus sp.]